MSGTQNTTTAQPGAAQPIVPKTETAQSQPGAAETPAQKMDRLLRSDRPGSLKKQIEKLRQEAAQNRAAARDALEAKAELEKKAAEISAELAQLKSAHRAEMIMRKFDAAGCVKSSLALKDVPEDCTDLDKFIETYRIENPFLFTKNKTLHGGLFKPQKTEVLTPSQRMDRAIRTALGRK